ncbi:arsenic resistance protein [Kocuria sp.]|uniref:arsenic resistance protein n=1 Tax=Kocuria sp. TaxID=1871328 RepID=UPI0026DEA3F5|nr:arsenic resistance protein [Kocuria sp.]MDO5618157.1 arsenic resistance protein [Kocuria sp.]
MDFLERHQVGFYLGSVAVGLLLGLTVPTFATGLEALINPAIAVMLWSTFLAIPMVRVVQALRDIKFLGLLLGLNFLVVPAVVWLLTRPLTDHPALLLGVVLVLLVPCVDWVIVFTGLAGGDSARMTAATPVLMVAQMLVLAPLVVLIGGPELVVDVAPGPFITALLVLLVLPLLLAAGVQSWATRSAAAARIQRVGQGAMVPSLMVVLVLVVASQIAGVGSRWVEVIWTVPVFVAFVVTMTALATLSTRVFRTTTSPARAIVFSCVARNSLVVLPLALALPEQFDLVPLVVLTQTVVELAAMVLLLRVVPALVPERGIAE